MQLRKLIRILKDIETKYGDRIKISVQTEDFKNCYFQFQEISEVGISECFYEDPGGWLKDNPTRVVSIGLENPNLETFK